MKYIIYFVLCILFFQSMPVLGCESQVETLIPQSSTTSGQKANINDSMAYINCDTFANSSTHIIKWAGLNWTCKNVHDLGPGTNNFSDSPNNLWVDDQNRLHLTIKKNNGRWDCTQLACENDYRFGKLTWKIDNASSVFNLSQDSTCLGLFSYKDDYNETDVEISRWQGLRNHLVLDTVYPYWIRGNSKGYLPSGKWDRTQLLACLGLFSYRDDNNDIDVKISRRQRQVNYLVLYTVQPYWILGNSKGYLPSKTCNGSTTDQNGYDGSGITVSIDREPDYIDFTTLDRKGKVIAYEHFTNSSSIDREAEKLMMNLYLRSIPTNGSDMECIIDSLKVEATPV